MYQARYRDIGRIEILGIRFEFYRGARVALAHLVDYFQIGFLFTIGKGHAMKLAAALDQHFKFSGQRVHD